MSTRAAMAVLALAVTLLCAAGTVSVLGRSGGQPGIDRAAREAGRRFLDRYVDDGRVVRRDQGGDTVSEGQAYGMLIAATLGDEEEFRQIWWWTRRHLGRGDGLLSYRWRDGSVVDPQSAADAVRDVLDRVAGVVESAVIGLPHPDFGEAVAAVIVREPDATLADVLRKWRLSCSRPTVFRYLRRLGYSRKRGRSERASAIAKT